MTAPAKRPACLWDAAAVLLGAFLLGVIFWSVEGADPMWAIISFVLVYDPEARLVLSTACARLFMTILGSAFAMGAVLAFGIHKWTLPVSLTLVALGAGFFLRSRSSWRILLVTVALVIGSALLQPSLASYVAVMRSIEVSAGSLLAVVFSWLVGRESISAKRRDASWKPKDGF